MPPRIRVITLITSDARTAGQKPSTSNLSLHSAVSNNIEAFTTIRNSPKVKITAGRVSNLTKPPRIELINPNKSAT